MRGPDVLHYLEAVRNRPEIDHLVATGFVVNAPGWSSNNAVLKLWKPRWEVPAPGDTAHSALIHFETRRREVAAAERGEARLEVDHVPYEPSISKKPDMLVEYAECLKLKAALLHELRQSVMSYSVFVEGSGASTENLWRTDHTDTQCAVKFRSGLVSDPPADAYARWLAALVQRVTPVVDTIIARYGSS